MENQATCIDLLPKTKFYNLTLRGLKSPWRSWSSWCSIGNLQMLCSRSILLIPSDGSTWGLYWSPGQANWPCQVLPSLVGRSRVFKSTDSTAGFSLAAKGTGRRQCQKSVPVTEYFADSPMLHGLLAVWSSRSGCLILFACVFLELGHLNWCSEILNTAFDSHILLCLCTIVWRWQNDWPNNMFFHSRWSILQVSASYLNYIPELSWNWIYSGSSLQLLIASLSLSILCPWQTAINDVWSSVLDAERKFVMVEAGNTEICCDLSYKYYIILYMCIENIHHLYRNAISNLCLHQACRISNSQFATSKFAFLHFAAVFQLTNVRPEVFLMASHFGGGSVCSCWGLGWHGWRV